MLHAKAAQIENKISDITYLATKAVLNTKAEEAERNVPDITNLAMKATLNTYPIDNENIIPDTIGFSTTPECNTLTKTSFDAKTKETKRNLKSKIQVDNDYDKTN